MSDLSTSGASRTGRRIVGKADDPVEIGAHQPGPTRTREHNWSSPSGPPDSIPGLEIEANGRSLLLHGAHAGSVDDGTGFSTPSRAGPPRLGRFADRRGRFRQRIRPDTVEPVRETLRQTVADKLSSRSVPSGRLILAVRQPAPDARTY